MVDTDITYVKQLIDSSLYFEANHLLQQFLKEHPDNLEIRQLQALSYSRSGAVERAKEFFESIYLANKENPEVSGIMGGIFKRLFQQDQDPRYGIKAAEIYQRNFEVSGDFYTGINAASMLFMVGKALKGKEIATQIIEQLGMPSDDVWALATLGEAHLLLKNRAQSKDLYIAARKLIRKDWGKLNAVYKQLWLLKHYIAVPRDIIDLFHPPSVTVFSGHMLDHPQRKEPRFTMAMEPAVKEAVREAIHTMNIEIGYSSLACGADILFAEVMLEQEKALNLVLPFDKEDFLNESVRFAGKEWEERFNLIIEQVQPEYVTHSRYTGGNESFEFLSKLLMGKGILHAYRIDSEANLLTVLSKHSLETKLGGTRYFYNLWPAKLEKHNINIEKYFKPPVQSGVPVPVTETANTSYYPNDSVISYMMVVKSEDCEIYFSNLKAYIERNMFPLYSTYQKGDIFTVHFKNEINAMDCLSEILDNRQTAPLTILLHAGPVKYDPALEKASEMDLELAFELIELVPPDKSSATENFISCLALKSPESRFDFRGRLEVSNKHVVSIYHLKVSD